jgi:alanine racemase
MPQVQTHVDLSRIRSNAARIREETGVAIIGVLKADAYGHGAVSVADAISEYVDQWYVFTPGEAVRARLFDLTGKKTLAGMVTTDTDVEMLVDNGIRPAVWTVEAARHFASADPALAVDSGMQRFACPEEQLDAMFAVYPFKEAYTHASRPEMAIRFGELTAGRPNLKRHAAATALMGDVRCRFDAVRPGLALYEGVARVTARLVDARDERGPVGYTGFSSPNRRHGVIRAGYSDCLRLGPVLVNGRPQRLLEIGMQSAYVSLDAGDRIGDEVVLLGDSLTAADVAKAWGTTPQQALQTLAGIGEKVY